MKNNSKGASFNDRVLAGEVRSLGLEQLKKVLDPKYKDKQYQKAMLLKIAPALLPRLNEHTGQGGGPLQITFDSSFNDLHQKQREVVRSPARFKTVRAGRRSGKTSLEIEDMAFTAMSENDSPVFYIAPTQKQARELIWEALKSRLAGIGQPSEQRLEMVVPTRDARQIHHLCCWLGEPRNFRGKKAKKIFFDEVDTMKDFFMAWQEIFRPALIDYGGDAMFAGTPKKENPNLRRLEKMAETDPDYEATTGVSPFRTTIY
jgi:hypothetical protein